MRLPGWQVDAQVWARVLPFALYMVFLAIEGGVVEYAPGIDVRWFYPLKIGVVVAALWRFRKFYSELADRPTWFWAGLLAPLLGVLVFVLWINLDFGWMVIGGGPGFDPRDASGAYNWMLVSTRLIGAALVVPLMEELFWRSFLLRWIQAPRFLDLAPVQIGLRAVLIGSVLFGIEHSLWLAGIVAGLVYAWLYRAAGNLWPPIVAHGVTNLLLGLWVLNSSQWQFW